MATGKHHDVLATVIDVAATGTSYVTFALGDDSGGSPQTTTPSMGSGTALTEAHSLMKPSLSDDVNRAAPSREA